MDVQPDGFSLEISAARVDFLPPITGEPEGGRDKSRQLARNDKKAPEDTKDLYIDCSAMLHHAAKHGE